ncbi:MAG: hypothetical protein K2P22_03815 [Lachnospiraceae bacterium]|nr:hypothetical protein [Lachnospiraceae bacterium]
MIAEEHFVIGTENGPASPRPACCRGDFLFMALAYGCIWFGDPVETDKIHKKEAAFWFNS